MSATIIPFRVGDRESNWSRPVARPIETEIMRQHVRDAYAARAWPEHLNDWEKRFLDSIVDERNPTQRQRDVLQTICRKVARLRMREGAHA